ncbi:MAG: hypothetical protein HOI95_09485 [Chromatiales bacterium]|jgi:hypothetical protein|nr:hypothetical protein [Chromatiales bacterium]
MGCGLVREGLVSGRARLSVGLLLAKHAQANLDLVMDRPYGQLAYTATRYVIAAGPGPGAPLGDLTPPLAMGEP